jgi:hypothetical protein
VHSDGGDAHEKGIGHHGDGCHGCGTTMTAPAEARGWGHRGFGIGPGLAFGLAAGALTAGAIAASEPYYWGPGYGYYGPTYYYGGGPYAYYGGPYYRRHYYRPYW